MVRLARALDGAAAELHRLRPHVDAAVVAAGPSPTPVLVPLGRSAAWADGAAGEVRRRARDLAADGPSDGDRFRPPPFLGAQRGKKNLRLTDAEAQLTRADEAARDPTGGRKAQKARNKMEKRQGKATGSRRNRVRKDAKPSPAEKAAVRRGQGKGKKPAARDGADRDASAKTKPARHVPDQAKKARKAKRDAANRGGTLAAVALGVWWAGKALSPLCGPAAPACAVVL